MLEDTSVWSRWNWHAWWTDKQKTSGYFYIVSRRQFRMEKLTLVGIDMVDKMDMVDSIDMVNMQKTFGYLASFVPDWPS